MSHVKKNDRIILYSNSVVGMNKMSKKYTVSAEVVADYLGSPKDIFLPTGLVWFDPVRMLYNVEIPDQRLSKPGLAYLTSSTTWLLPEFEAPMADLPHLMQDATWEELKAMLEIFTPDQLPMEAMRVLNIASSGKGKTYLAGSFPKPLVADFDGGSLTLKQHPNAANIRIIRPKSATLTVPDGKGGMITMRDVPKWSWPEILEFIMNPRKFYPECETIVIDNFSFLTRHILSSSIRSQDKVKPTLEDIGLTIERTRQILDKIIAYPFHVYATTLPEIVKDELEVQIVRPHMLGKDLPDEVPAAFDYVCWENKTIDVKSGDSVHTLDFVGDRVHPAKSRFGKLSNAEPANFAEILKKVLPTSATTPTTSK